MLPMGGGGLKVVGRESRDVIREYGEGFGVVGGSHVRLESEVGAFERATKSRGVHCSMLEQFVASGGETDEIVRLILVGFLLRALGASIGTGRDGLG